MVHIMYIKNELKINRMYLRKQKVLNENELHYSFEKLLLSVIRFWNQKYGVSF